MSTSERLRREAAESNLPLASEAFARALDAKDPLAHLRAEFAIPRKRPHGANGTEAAAKGPSAQPSTASFDDASANGSHEPEEVTYLCGNSLGLQPKESRRLVEQEFDVWAERSALVFEALLAAHNLLMGCGTRQGRGWSL